MTQLSSLLLFHYLLKTLTFLSNVATRGPGLYLASFICFHILPPPSRFCHAHICDCVLPLWMSLFKVIWSVCRGRALAAQVTHTFLISSLVQEKKKRDAGWLTPSSLPPFQFKSTRRWERMKTKWAGEMFRGSDREIRDQAETRKPLCVSTGPCHTNPSLPSQEHNDLCMHPQWVDLRLSCRGQVGHAQSVCDRGLLSEIKDWRCSPMLLVHIFLWDFLTASLRHPQRLLKAWKMFEGFQFLFCCCLNLSQHQNVETLGVFPAAMLCLGRTPCKAV